MGNVDGIAYNESDDVTPIGVVSSDYVPTVSEYKVANDTVLDIESWAVYPDVVEITLKNKTHTQYGIEHPAKVIINRVKLKEFLKDVLK